MQNTYKLPVWNTLDIAWKKVAGTKLVILGGVLTTAFITVTLFFLSHYLNETHHPVMYSLMTIFRNVIGLLLGAGLILYGLKRAFDLPIHYSMVFAAFDKRVGFKIILLYLLMFLILLPICILIMGVSLLGMLGIFLPSIGALFAALTYVLSTFLLIYLCVRVSLAIRFILVRGSGPWEAIKLSFAATRRNFWRLFALKVLTSFLIIISIIPLGIGLIWTIPLRYITEGEIFKRLSAQVEKQ